MQSLPHTVNPLAKVEGAILQPPLLFQVFFLFAGVVEAVRVDGFLLQPLVGCCAEPHLFTGQGKGINTLPFCSPLHRVAV